MTADPPTTGRLGELRDKIHENYDYVAVCRIVVYRYPT
jgi:hypothetical protein